MTTISGAPRPVVVQPPSTKALAAASTASTAAAAPTPRPSSSFDLQPVRAQAAAAPRAAAPPPVTAEARALTAEWPGGAPVTRTRIEQVTLQVSRADRVAVVLAALPAAEATRARALLTPEGKVTEASLDAAYAAVLNARKSPGTRNLALSLEPLVWTTGGREKRLVPTPPVVVKGTVTVTADGRVNGKPLVVDQLARLSSQLAKVPADAKDASLRDAGLSAQWVARATPQQKEYALASLRLASLTPGKKSLDLSFMHHLEGREKLPYAVPGRLTFTVTADGKVNG
ncbi:MAG: hypothetical protein JNM17_26110, partial [Archangium sp.]|nr:hypothetical protein [Archangium sp.]